MTFAETFYGAIAKTVKSMGPVSFQFGIVTSANPLKIMLDDGLEVPRDNIILTDNVRDMKYTIRRRELTTENTGNNWTTSSNSQHSHSIPLGGTHKHKIITENEITIYRRLNLGEKVLIANVQGGNRFVVLSRAEDRDKIFDPLPIDATQKGDFVHEPPEPYINED